MEYFATGIIMKIDEPKMFSERSQYTILELETLLFDNQLFETYALLRFIYSSKLSIHPSPGFLCKYFLLV